MRVLQGTAVPASKTTLSRWRESPGFEFVEKMLRSASVEEILSRDYLAARHEDIEQANGEITRLNGETAELHGQIAELCAKLADDDLLWLDPRPARNHAGGRR